MDSILDKMQVNQSVDNLLEVGCGYGTFTINTAKRISGKLTAFDIEREMIDYTKNKAIQIGLTHIGLFNHIGEQLRNYVTAGGEILACGNCIKSAS